MVDSTSAVIPIGGDGDIVRLLRERMNTEEQSLFIDSFHMYLRYGTRSDFVIDLDDVYGWLGYARKDTAKAVIVKHLTESIQYKISSDSQAGVLLLSSPEQNSDGRGGRNKERIMMTVRGFKQLCMVANTGKATVIRDYYLTMEDAFHEVTQLWLDASVARIALQQAALDDKDRAITEAMAQRDADSERHEALAALQVALTREGIAMSAERARHDTLIASNVGKACVYAVKVMMSDDEYVYVVKIGETTCIKTRVPGLRAEYGMAILLDVFPCVNAHVCEQHVIHLPDFVAHKYNEPINGHNGTEVFLVTPAWTYAANVKPVLAGAAADFADRERFVELQRLKLLERREIRLGAAEERMRAAEERMRATEERMRATEERMRRRDESLTALLADVAPERRIEFLAAYRAAMGDLPTEPCSPILLPDDPHVETDDVITDDTDSLTIASPRDVSPTPPEPRSYAGQGRGRRVVQYDVHDLTHPIATFEGTREAARAVRNAKGNCIRNACETNVAYLGFRWVAVERDDGPAVSEAIPATAAPRRRAGRVAQLTPDLSRIVAVHPDMVRAAETTGQKNSSSITTAMNRASIAGGHRWLMFDECAAELRDAFGDAGCDLPVGQERGKHVLQLHPVTGDVLAEHASLSVVCDKFQTSHKSINRACGNGAVLKGFKWRMAVDLA